MVKIGGWLETVFQDLRFGLRELRKSAGFTATAILSLALGIMAATAMYSVIHGVVLDPFPYKDVDNLVSIAIRNPEQRGWRTSYSVDEYAELAARATIFEGLAGCTISDVLWVSNGNPAGSAEIIFRTRDLMLWVCRLSWAGRYPAPKRSRKRRPFWAIGSGRMNLAPIRR